MKRYYYSRFMFRILLYLLMTNNYGVFSQDKQQITVYPAPINEILSKDYMLEVNGQSVDIYLAEIATVDNPEGWMLQLEDVGGPYSFTYFDFSGEVKIKVTSLKKPLDKVVIRPLSAGIETKLDGNTVTFIINKPCKLSIEPDGREHF